MGFIVGGTAFGRFEVVPRLRDTARKERLSVGDIGVHELQEQRHIAAKLAVGGAAIGAQHTIAVGVRSKQDLLDEEGGRA